MPWNDNKNGNGGPWGSGGSDGNGNSPWGRPQGGGSGNNGPDLEDQIKKMQDRFRGRFGGGRDGGSGGKTGPFPFIIIALIALAAWLSTGVVIVNPNQQAVVFRFGSFERTLGPGFHLRLPTPVESHVAVDVEDQLEIRIGNTASEALMLTEDENIVDIEFSVFYKVKTTAPEDYVLNVRDPDEAVRMVAESVMREVVGKSQLQNVITTQRDAVQVAVRQQTQDLLDEYNAGIDIIDIQIARSDPPQPVISAFNDVNKAEQDAQTLINEARRYAGQVVPEARGTAQRLLQEAEGYRDRVIADATGDASRFTQVYNEYRQAPQVTRERLYLETMERVLGGADKTLLDSGSGAVPYLPLDQIRRPTTPSGQ